MASFLERGEWNDTEWNEYRKKAAKIREFYALYISMEREYREKHDPLFWQLWEPPVGSRGYIPNTVTNLRGYGSVGTNDISFRIDAVLWNDLTHQQRVYVSGTYLIHARNVENMILLRYSDERGVSFIGTRRDLFKFLQRNFEDTYGVEFNQGFF